MLVKNLTPFFHGAKLTSRRARQPEMCFVVRGTFRLVHGGAVEPIEGLDQGLMTGEVYADDDPERAGELLYPGDFADMKPVGEVMLKGTCHVPGGKPVALSSAGFSVGAWRKDVAVLGDRRWDHSGILGSKPTEARPFRSMPLTWSRAFGGIGSQVNPAGRAAAQGQLPNVELLEAPIRGRSDAPAPVGFGPINPAWLPRAEKVGKNYGKSWLAERAPYLADDHDWRWFNAAPADQQLDGYLQGDEELAFRNLHPELATLKTRLPALRVRTFWLDGRGGFREVKMVLDTLFADTDEGTVKLTWRGLDAVRDDELADVAFVLVVSEPLAAPPEPATFYEAQLQAFAEDPTGVHAALPPALVEAGEREAERRRGEVVPEPALPPGGLAPDLDPISRELKGRLGGLMNDEQLAATREAVAQMHKATPPGAPPVDLDKAVQDGRAAQRKEAPIPRMVKPGRLPDVRLRAQMRRMLDEVERLRTLEKQSGQKIDGIEELAAIPHQPEWKKLDPDYEVPGPLSTDAPGPGADLRDRDFSEQDLAGIDLTGANLERASFVRANLRGARLGGAKLSRAVLYLADLTDADLSGADLTLVHAAYMKAAGADFTGASLAEAFLEGAVLTRARLDDVIAPYAMLEGADLTGVSARNAKLERADLTGARLDGAVLTGAFAPVAKFTGASLVKAHLGGATLPQASFADADLTGATMVGAQVQKGFFMRTRLEGADLSFANLAGAFLTDAKAARARFHGADLREVRADRADLTLADFGLANLMSADLRKATIEAARFVGANLYDARLVGVRGGGFDVDGANLKRSVWDRA